MRLFKNIHFLLFLVFGNCFAQLPTQEIDFRLVDSTARSIQYKNDLKLLVSDLTKNHNTDLLKARAIFVWIADNIAYDYKQYNKGKSKGYKCKKGEDCGIVFLKWEDELLERTLSKKMAVCEGYARLFKRMCDYSGVSCKIIAGYTKNDEAEIGRMGRLDHAWNNVLIDGNHYYLDVTWAAGGCSTNNKGKLEEFHKNYNNYYWLTPNDKHFRDHFPKDPLAPGVMVNSKERYKNAPFIVPQFIDDIDVISPDTGVLNVCLGDTIHFKVRHDNMLWQSVQLNTNIDRAPNLAPGDYEMWKENRDKHKSIPHTMKNYVFEFDYAALDEKVKYIDVYFDHMHTLRFKVNVTK